MSLNNFFKMPQNKFEAFELISDIDNKLFNLIMIYVLIKVMSYSQIWNLPFVSLAILFVILFKYFYPIFRTRMIKERLEADKDE